tara:strand:+ start:4339 stop:4653 length:315 start_codon:yes stop_codon:yes gene_type:complete
VKKIIFLSGLFLAGLEIQKMSDNLFCIVLVRQDRFSLYQESQLSGSFLFLLKNSFIFFYFVKLFLIEYQLLFATFFTTLSEAKCFCMWFTTFTYCPHSAVNALL